ncbi:MAG: tol-pal system YbgF family protein [bacterium]
MFNKKEKNGIFILLVIILFGYGCQQKESQPKFDVSRLREYANALYNRQLYQQAVQEYNEILQNYDLDESEAANLNYIIGDIYFERIRDYENALTYYLKIKHLYQNSALMDEVNKKMVECLERLERSADAQQVMEEAALLDPTRARPHRPGEVIAKIGKQRITTGDLEHEINNLPPYLRAQYNDKSKKLDFLKEYISTQLLYASAKRKGLDKDKDVIEATFEAKKKFMAQKLLEDEISKEIDIKESDVELYYQAHKDNYAKKDDEGKVIATRPFKEVKNKVTQDLILMKQKEAYELLIQRLMRAENVEVYEDKVR